MSAEAYSHPPQFAGRYEGCVLDGQGNCSRWNHDHAPAVAVASIEAAGAALDVARKAEQAERRAEAAEVEVERLLDVLAEVRRVFDLQCPPMSADRYVDRGAWMAHSWWNTVLGGILSEMRPLPIHRTEAGYPSCSTCDGGGCYDCTDPA